MPQLVIADEPALGLPGQNAFPFLGIPHIDTWAVYGGYIPAGCLVVRQAEDVCRLPAATGDISGNALLGVIMRDPTEPTDVLGWAVGKTAPVMRKGGYIWVYTETAVVQNQPVYSRHAANGGLTQLGSFRGDVDGGNATLVSNWRWYRSAAAAGMAVIEVR
jgi:hypothetical protein